VIPRSIRLSEAPSHGEPIQRYDPLSTGAQAYDDVALELLDQLRRGQVVAAPVAASEEGEEGDVDGA
jgi:hypothetical protein